MKVHRSARKHDITDLDSLHAAKYAVYSSPLDDNSPARELRLGFDPAGRLLELVVLRFDSGEQLIIHSMKARPQYFDLLG